MTWAFQQAMAKRAAYVWVACLFVLAAIQPVDAGALWQQGSTEYLHVEPIVAPTSLGAPDLLVLVAGRIRLDDPLQANIHYVTGTAYELFRANGYGDQQIVYLATDPALPGVDAMPTASALQAAITGWAVERTGIDGILTIYLVNHGDTELFFLDRPNGQQVRPAELAAWLDQLDAIRPDIQVNVIVEAAYAGGFIDPPTTISRPGRLIITSTGAEHLAWASDRGAIFSDTFLGAMGTGASLDAAFKLGQWAVLLSGHDQTPWLDGDGDGIPNELDDHEIARQMQLFAMPSTPSAPEDVYEPDDNCASASSIPATGLVQRHIFGQEADVDWVRFNVISGVGYQLDVQVPPGSTADVALQVMVGCDGPVIDEWDQDFSPGVRMHFAIQDDTTLYVRLSNHDQAVYGTQTAYDLSVRVLDQPSNPGKLVIVAGRLHSAYPHQNNLYETSDRVYRLFRTVGYSRACVTYLAHDLERPGVDNPPTAHNIQQAITSDPAGCLGAGGSLTLFIAGACSPDRLLLDANAGEAVTPDDLDGWLNTIEADWPGLKTNVIMEGCYTGSFIGRAHSLSAPDRLVIAATASAAPAWASDQGLLFSDYWLAALESGAGLYRAYQSAIWAVQAVHPAQTPWLDADGDGLPNEAEDETAAAQRGLPYVMAFCGSVQGPAHQAKSSALPEHQAPICVPSWPPYLVQAEITGSLVGGRGELRAQVRDDDAVALVWAEIFPPSYHAPDVCVGWMQDPVDRIVMVSQGGDWYGANYDGFDQAGTYHVVFYAKDNEDLDARPMSVWVNIRATVHLPLILR